jgi:two-component system NtrC family sensor kinase
VVRSLSAKLFLWTFGTILVAFAVHAWISVRASTAEWDRNALASAARLTDLLLGSTRYHMLLNRKDDVHQIIRAVARQDTVRGVRIYDKQGIIIHSADETEIGRRVDRQAEACVVCHERSEPLHSVSTAGRSRVYRDPSGDRVLGLIAPIENRPECSNAPCHAHPADQTILGVLDTKISLAGADVLLARARKRMLAAGTLIALAAGLVSAGFLVRGVSAPVRRLIVGTDRVAAGNLAVEIEIRSTDEMGQLARAFNHMTRDLREARNELTAWSARLETRLTEKTTELERSQRQVVHMEKMVSLGQLAATVAHEINNPLAGVLSYARLAERTLDEAPTPQAAEELHGYLAVIRRETARCGDIVRNLLVFARRSGAEMAERPLRPIVERALVLVRHHLEMAQVKLEVELEDGGASLFCDADQVQQALVALMINAAEAMPEGGTLSVRTSVGADELRIDVQDTGHGIAPEDLSRLFEPFFTTKESCGGVGLGLAVVYGIARRHAGDVEVDSSPGRGARFTLVLARDPRRSHEPVNVRT